MRYLPAEERHPWRVRNVQNTTSCVLWMFYFLRDRRIAVIRCGCCISTGVIHEQTFIKQTAMIGRGGLVDQVDEGGTDVHDAFQYVSQFSQLKTLVAGESCA